MCDSILHCLWRWRHPTWARPFDDLVFLKITCNLGRPHLQAGYPSAFSLNQDAIQGLRKEGGKTTGDVLLSWKTSLAESDLRNHWSGLHFPSSLEDALGGALTTEGNGMHSPRLIGNRESRLTSTSTFLQIPDSAVLGVYMVLGIVPSAMKGISRDKRGLLTWALIWWLGRFEVPRRYVIYVEWYGYAKRAEASERTTPQPIAKMVSSPGVIYKSVLVSHLVYLATAGKEKGTKGGIKKGGGERFFSPLVFCYWFDIEKTDHPPVTVTTDI